MIRIVFFFLISYKILLAGGDAKLRACKDQDSIKVLAYFKSYYTDAIGLMKEPIHWNVAQWSLTGAYISTTALLYTQDVKITEFFSSKQNNAFDFVGNYIAEPWGRSIYPLGIITGIGAYGLFTHDNQKLNQALLGVKVFVFSAGAVTIQKHLFHRHRPYQHTPYNATIFEGPFSGFSYASFPSGHTTVAFAMSTFFAMTYSDSKWVKYLVYPLAILTGLQRIYDEKHWSSDVFWGAISGHYVARFIINSEKNTLLSYNLVCTPDYYGLNLNIPIGSNTKNIFSFEKLNF